MADTDTTSPTPPPAEEEPTTSSSSKGDHRTALGTAAYTFYLNLVVIENVVVSSSSSSPPPEPADASSDAVPTAGKDEESDSVPTTTTTSKEGEETTTKEEEGGEASHKNKLVSIQALPFYTIKGMNMNMKMKSMKLDESLYSFSKAMSKTSQAMSKTSQAMSKTAEGVSQRAAAFVASKTMVSRATTALDKSLDELQFLDSDDNDPQKQQQQQLQVTLGKRFQQGNVIVVQVHLKASDLPVYIQHVRGPDAAQHYRSAVAALQALKALQALARLEQEMLPQIRHDLMEHFGTKLSQAMKEKDSSLVFQCIPLEESEEAHWLFTFMEFQAQMNKKEHNFRMTPLRNEVG